MGSRPESRVTDTRNRLPLQPGLHPQALRSLAMYSCILYVCGGKGACPCALSLAGARPIRQAAYDRT